MRKTILLSVLSILVMPFAMNAQEPRVFTDADLNQYKYKGDESNYRYNQQINQQDYEREYQGVKRVHINNQNASAESENARRREALDKINQIENEKAQEKIDKGKRMRTTSWMENRDAQQRKERDIQRETELDSAYRDAGLSNERESQRDRESRNKGSLPPAPPMQQNIKQETEKTYWDAGSKRYVHCPPGGAVCY